MADSPCITAQESETGSEELHTLACAPCDALRKQVVGITVEMNQKLTCTIPAHSQAQVCVR